MTEPTEDEEDGKLWLWDFEDIDDEPGARERVADDSLRAEYLIRALELLRHEKI